MPNEWQDDIDQKMKELGFNFFDRENRPLTVVQYAELKRLPGYARIERTQVGEYDVSTVWIGFDPNYLPPEITELFGAPIPESLRYGFYHTKPLIFETMAFGPEGHDVGRDRYTTEAAARAGHAAMVKWVRDELNSGVDK